MCAEVDLLYRISQGCTNKKKIMPGGRAFLAWVEKRNKAMPSDPVPDGLLACYYASIVSK